MSVVQKAGPRGPTVDVVGTVARADCARPSTRAGFKVELVGGVVGRVCEVVDEEKGGD